MDGLPERRGCHQRRAEDSGSSGAVDHLPILAGNEDPRLGQARVDRADDVRVKHDNVLQVIRLILGSNNALQILGGSHDGESEAGSHAENLLSLGGSLHACLDGFAIEIRLGFGARKDGATGTGCASGGEWRGLARGPVDDGNCREARGGAWWGWQRLGSGGLRLRAAWGSGDADGDGLDCTVELSFAAVPLVFVVLKCAVVGQERRWVCAALPGGRNRSRW